MGLKNKKVSEINNSLRSNCKRFFRPLEVFQTLIALNLILGCLLAAQWQFHRGQARVANNSIIRVNENQTPSAIENLAAINPLKDQWRQFKIAGAFDPNHQSLIRNRYNQGRYGFEVLQLFHLSTALPAKESIWLDRGWVSAGKSAATAPTIPPVSSNQVSVVVRVRSENVSKQLQGSFFATKSNYNTVNLTQLQGVSAQNYYADLISSSDKSTAPLTIIELPDISDGPHYAYAIQWLAFGLMIAIGRVLLFKNT